MSEQNKLTIQTLERHTDWLAYAHKPFSCKDHLWEAAQTEAEAIAKLRAANPELFENAEVETE